jgi:hypothetical protein
MFAETPRRSDGSAACVRWRLASLEQGDVAMTHPNAFDGLFGFVTLHPLLTLGPVLLVLGLAAVIAGRRRRL